MYPRLPQEEEYKFKEHLSDGCRRDKNTSLIALVATPHCCTRYESYRFDPTSILVGVAV